MVDEKSNTDQPAPEEWPESMDAAMSESFDMEDSFLTESLSGLSKVTVPASFLPNVMFRVYEKHHREKLPRLFIVAASLVLAVLCALFFALDVNAYTTSHNVSSFAEGMTLKLDLLRDFSSRLAAESAGFFTAAWRIIAGAASATSTSTLLLLALGLALTIYLVKKGVTALMG